MNTNQNVSNEVVESTKEDEVVFTKAEQVAYDFAIAIQNEDYDTAFGMLDIKDKTFVSLEDFSWFIPRSSLSDLTGTDYKLVSYDSTGDKVKNSTKFVFKPVTITVNTFLNDNNEWKVSFDEAFVTNWKISIPRDTSLTLNGIEVSSDYLDEMKDNEFVYNIPCIATKEADLVVKTSLFGDFNLKTLPSAIETTMVNCELTSEQYSPLYEDLLTLLNTMNTGYENGERLGEFSKYVSTETSASQLERLFNDVDAQYTENAGGEPYNIRFTIVKPRDGENANAVLVKDNVVKLNLSVEKTWDVRKSGIGDNTSRVHGSIYVVKEDDGLKIYQYDDDFIKERNWMGKEW